MIAAHADWSMDARKRWVTIARRQGALWQASAPRLVGDPARLAAFLIAEGGPAALGLDLPLGVPRGFAEGRQEADFPGFLAGLAQSQHNFFRVKRLAAVVFFNDYRKRVLNFFMGGEALLTCKAFTAPADC